MNPVIEYADNHFSESVEELKKLVRIPSVSFEGFPQEEVRRSAKAVANLLLENGLENVEILEMDGAHPYVYGDWLHVPGKPTLLLYAHHDVQPPGETSKWNSKPFEPVEKDGRLWGRGAADDKAGVIVHVSAISAFLRTRGKLPLNVKVLIEGEEEIGSEHLNSFLKKYRSKMAADTMVLTDTSNFDVGIPTITTSLRGLVAVEVEVRVMKQSVHSGGWGGPVPDPILALSKMLASLLDSEGRIAIKGIYDDVRPLTKIEEESMARLSYGDSEYRKQISLVPSAKILGGNASPLVKMTRLPSLSVNAIQASSRQNKANIINATAWCKVGIRIVPDMDPAKTEKLLIDHLRSQAPWGVEVDIHADSRAGWWFTNPTHPAFTKAKHALTKAFAHECVFLGCGGSIPFVGPFSEVLGGVPALLIGVEDPYTNAHSENESVHLGDLKKSILGAIYLYEALAE